jgi:hypothetical protein
MARIAFWALGSRDLETALMKSFVRTGEQAFRAELDPFGIGAFGLERRERVP